MRDAGATGRRLAVAWLAGLLLFFPKPASARVLQHVVQKGDTVELLAAEYYGDRDLGIFIVAANGWTVPPRPLPVGDTIAIPISFRITVQPGDTLLSLAKTYLGDARRATYLGALNGVPPGREPEAGADLLVPYNLHHRATRPQTLEQVAALYYGDPSKASLLGEYNFRQDLPLDPGEVISVPITDLEVRPTKLGPASQSLAVDAADAAIQERASRVALGLRTAASAYESGEYATVADQLLTLIGEGPTDAELAEIHQLLAYDYVALGIPELAVRQFLEVLARKPDLELDPALVSPKIRAAFDEARRRLRRP